VIVGFSTSARVASVAIFAPEGRLLWSGREDAPQAASGACLRLLAVGLQETGLELRDASLFVADLGPGSFTGVRVGVTLAKTLAYALGAKAGGADAFDLVDPSKTVVLPNKKGEWFVRKPGQPVQRVSTLPAEPLTGYGPGTGLETHPDAENFGALLPGLTPVAPEALVPAYLAEPSISTPKKPFGANVAQ
jgi:tRNA threonylcarbamoyladenosine biosynthesis protein TsaB